jgi:hypothetical protein
MLQTLWDSLQQVIRIALYAGSGALVTAGIIDQGTAVTLAGAILALLNGVWTVYWNRSQVVTVDGMAAAAKNPAIPVSGATSLEIKAAKR